MLHKPDKLTCYLQPGVRSTEESERQSDRLKSLGRSVADRGDSLIRAVDAGKGEPP